MASLGLLGIALLGWSFFHRKSNEPGFERVKLSNGGEVRVRGTLPLPMGLDAWEWSYRQVSSSEKVDERAAA